jgi:hypothetical protein
MATPADENELGGTYVPSDPTPFCGYVFSMSWRHFRKKRKNKQYLANRESLFESAHADEVLASI